MNLNLTILVQIQSKDFLPLVTISSRQIPAGSSLEQEFTDTYALIDDEIQLVYMCNTKVLGLPAKVEQYDRPWGEPWYSFRDIWVEKEGVIYVISFQSRLKRLEDNQKDFEEVLGSFQFK